MTKADAEIEKDYTVYVDKDPTDLQTRMTDWVLDKTGYDPAKAKTKAQAFADGIKLGVALRMEFQASPENQELLAEARRRFAEEQAKPKPVKAKKTKTKKPAPEPEEDDAEEEAGEAPKRSARGGKKRKPEPTPEPDEELEADEEEEAPKPARRGPAARRPARRRPPKDDDDADDAPF